MVMLKKIQLAVLLALLLANAAFALPPIAAEFYGTASVNGEFAIEGTNISVYDPSGTLCGSGLVRQEGQFGFISCNGDDPGTTIDEGAVQGENVTIAINGTAAKALPWFEGSINKAEINAIRKNISATAPAGMLLLPLIPAMAIIAAYLYIKRKL
jgi:hypothetical protein